MQGVNSKAACRFKITSELDGRALQILKEYLKVYAEMVQAAAPLSGVDLENAGKSFDEYLKTVVDHDPGVKGNIMLFGKTGGVERAMDMFFGL